jgi:predicted lipoprotein with Yx(FWY)xxD motif
MKERLGMLLFVAAFVVAGCSGGGGGSTGGGGGTIPIPTATPVPTATPTLAPQGNLPLSEAVSGSTAWVNPSSHKTLYFLDVDTATGGTCTQAAGGCLGVWPAFVPVAGSAAIDNMTIITRSDGTGQQWAYQGHPLYNYAGDTGPDQANGDNLPDFGGHWHVARPAAAPAPTPTGGGTPPPCHTYC